MSAQHTPATRADLDAVVASTVKHGVVRMARLTPTVDASAVDVLLDWTDLESWRSRETAKFWVHVYFLLIRWGDERHAARLDVIPPHEHYADMHAWLLRVRAFTADALRWKSLTRVSGADLSAKLPTKKAEQLVHIADRLGDPGWNPGPALVKAALGTRTFETEEGLALCAALLIHGDAESLKPLEPRGATEPLLAVVLAAHGMKVRDLEAERAGFVAAIGADPFNDGPRRVFADWLLEQGDPRGEFIQAQLHGLEAAATVQQRIAWTGQLLQVVRVKSAWKNYDPQKIALVPIYHRGFLSACCAQALDGTVASAPEWATIRILDVLGSIASIASYPLHRLQIVGGLQAGDLPVLLDSPFASQIQGIGLRKVLKAEERDLWDQVARFENLRFLCFDRYWNAEALQNHPLLDRIEVLAVPQWGPRSPEKAAITARVPTVLEWPWGEGSWMQAHDLLVERMDA